MTEQQKRIYNAYRDKKTPYQIAQLMGMSEDEVRTVLHSMRLGRSSAEDAHTLSSHRHLVEDHLERKRMEDEAYFLGVPL